MKQDIRTGPIDFITPGELNGALHEHANRLVSAATQAEMEVVRGIKIVKLPMLTSNPASTGLITLGAPNDNLGGAQGSADCGPLQGYVWKVIRVTVESSQADSTAVPSQPAVPASTVAAQNSNVYPVQVVISGGTLTAVVVNGVTVGTGDGTYYVPAGGNISVTYTVAPTWAWSNPTGYQTGDTGSVALYIASDSALQQNHLVDATLALNKAFFPSNVGGIMFGGEQIYAQVYATAGNRYTLTGIAVEVPAEMQGKLI